MNNRDVAKLTEKYVAQTYARYPIALVRGKGARVWDADGKEYLDFLAGIAVNSLGHCHPAVVRAIQKQSRKLLHVSNLYHIQPQAELARELCRHSFADRVFFCNSGAEANEAAIKLARRYGSEHLGGKYEILTAHNSFHGRTLATLTATGQGKVRAGYDPLPTGFRQIPYNDLKAAEQAIDEQKTVGIMVEPIQGEGGVNVPDEGYLHGLRELCDRRRLLLIFDEVQTGMGRTGKLFGYEHFGMQPDVMTLAKALGGGLPFGAMLAREEVAKSFIPGSHASTFGGNPLACSVGLAVMNTLLKALKPGTHLLLVGDVDQLPSVGAGDVLRDIIKSDLVPVTRLSLIFRQAAGSHIITNAHRINQGQMPLFAQESQDFFIFPAETPEDAAQWVQEVVSTRIPSRFGLRPKDQVQVLAPMYRGPAGVHALNERLQEALNPSGAMKAEKRLYGQTFRLGDKVMQVQNNYDKDVFNGDIGFVVSFDPIMHVMTVEYDGRRVDYDWSEADQIVLAYAVSVHKAQGPEFLAVVIPLVTAHYMMLQRNLLYTAITRGRKLVVLLAAKKAIAIAVNRADAGVREAGFRRVVLDDVQQRQLGVGRQELRHPFCAGCRWLAEVDANEDFLQVHATVSGAGRVISGSRSPPRRARCVLSRLG